MSNYFDPHEYDCWITGTQYKQAPHKPNEHNAEARKVMLSMFKDGRTITEIASQMKVSRSTVRRQLELMHIGTEQ